MWRSTQACMILSGFFFLFPVWKKVTSHKPLVTSPHGAYVQSANGWCAHSTPTPRNTSRQLIRSSVYHCLPCVLNLDVHRKSVFKFCAEVSYSKTQLKKWDNKSSEVSFGNTWEVGIRIGVSQNFILFSSETETVTCILENIYRRLERCWLHELSTKNYY